MSNALDFLNQTLDGLDGNNQPKSSSINGVPSYIVDAVIHQESRGNPNARSPKGAVGKMQLMADTARDMGLQVDDQVDERLDPDKNVKAGTKYLKQMYDKYKNWDDAFAAYNWGPGNVDKWIAQGRDISRLPDETKNYVNNLSPVANKSFNDYAKSMSGILGQDFTMQGLAPENKDRSLTNIDYVEQGALNTKLQDAWNSFKQGIDHTDVSTNYGKLDESQKVLDDLDYNKAVLKKMYEQHSIDAAELQEQLSELDDAALEARQKIIDRTKDINENEAELNNEPVSRKYKYQEWLTQSQGSLAGTWDKVQYTAPSIIGSSASMMGQHLVATYAAEIGKKLLTAGALALVPEPTASKVGALGALGSAAWLLYNARNQETYAELGDNLKQNQAALLEKWTQEHPGQEPQEEDLRKIRIQARKGLDDLRYENMALMVPDLIQAVIAPESKLGEVFTTLGKPIRWLDQTYSSLRDFNKVTRYGNTVSRGYLNYFSEKVEEGLQYAAAQRQQDVALDGGLYANEGAFRNLMTDAGDVLSSINYSPIGIIRNPDGRYSKDPNFQFAEEAGGMLSILPAGLIMSYSLLKDIQTYKKVSRALSNNPFADPDQKVLKLKAEIYAEAFENGSTHHLIEGIKALTSQKDLKGQPLLSKQDAEAEISNIKTAYQKYEAVNGYLNTLGGLFDSKETKEAKKELKIALFGTVLGQAKTEAEYQDLVRAKDAVLAKGNFSLDSRVEDFDHQILSRKVLKANLLNDIKNKPDEAQLRDYDKFLQILDKQIATIEKQKETFITENNIKVDDLEKDADLELFRANQDVIKPSLLRDYYDEVYKELKAIKDPKTAKAWLKNKQDLSAKKKEAYDRIQKAFKDEEEAKNPSVSTESPESSAGTQKSPEQAAASQNTAKTSAESIQEIEYETIMKQMITREGNAKNITEVINKTKKILDEIRAESEDKKESIEYFERVLDEHLDAVGESQDKLQARIENYLIKKYENKELPDKNYVKKLMKEFKSTFDLANGVQFAIKELQKDLKNLEEVSSDLQSKINYYNNLISDPRLKSLDLAELENKKAKLERKLTALQRGVEQVRTFIKDTLNFLADLTEIILGKYQKLEDFKKKYRFDRQYSSDTEQLKALLKREKEGTLDTASKNLLVNYPAIKKEYEALENELAEFLTNGDNAEKTKEEYEQDLKDLNDKILKFQKNIRFIGELIDDLKKLPKVEVKKPVQAAPVVTATPTPVTPTPGPVVSIPTSVDKKTIGTVQKIGTAEEMAILTEHEDPNTGLKSYIVIDKDGKESEVFQTGSWYMTNETYTKAEKEILNNPRHFNDLFSYNLSKERRSLEVVAAKIRDSKAGETLEQAKKRALKTYPGAFPSMTKGKPMLAKILNRPDFKNYLKLVVNTVFTDKNKDQDPIVFTSSTGLAGLRNTGIDIILKMTDPDTGEEFMLDHPYNPDFYAYLDEADQQYKLFNLDQMTPATFNKYFEFRYEKVNDAKIADLIQSWKDLRDFKTAVQAWFKGKPQNSEIPSEMYETLFTASLDFATSGDGFTPMKDVAALADAAIYYKDADPTKSKWASQKQDTLDVALIPQNWQGYYAVATLSNGVKKWIRLTPAKIMSLADQTNIVAGDINDLVKALAALDISDRSTLDEAKSLVKNLNFFVAGYGDQKIDALVQPSFDGSHYVLKFRLEAPGFEAKLVTFPTFVRGSSDVRTYSYNTFIDMINTAGQDIGVYIQAPNIRHSLPKSEVENNANNLHKFFDVTLRPNLIKDPSVKFAFYPEKLQATAPVDVAPVNTTSPEGDWNPFVETESDPKHANDVNTEAEAEYVSPDMLKAILMAQGISEEEATAMAGTQAEVVQEIEDEGTPSNTETPESDVDTFDDEKRKDDEAAFKIAHNFDINEPITLNEVKTKLLETLPAEFTAEDITNLHDNAAKNGIPVGAVIGKTMYLRDVADISDYYHETFHIVFRNLLSDSRSRAYLNKIKSTLNYSPAQIEAEKAKLRNTGKYDSFSEQDLEDLVYEEYLADQFHIWKKGQEVKSWLRQLFEKIMSFIKYAFSNNIEALYNKIENKGFKNSKILKTRFNAQGAFDTAYKLLYGASETLSEEVKYTLAAKMIEGSTFDSALAFYIEFYNPNSEENKKIIAGNAAVKKAFEDRHKIYRNKDNQKILDFEISKFLKDININFTEIQSEIGDLPERVFDLSDVFTDPYNRTGRKIKNIIATTLFETQSLGKPIKLALDPRTFYARLLPILSIQHTAPENMFKKLKVLGDYDKEIKAFYQRMVELTKYSEVDKTFGSDKGLQIFNSFKKAFEVYQMPFMNIVYSTGVKNKAKVIAANKLDLGKANLDNWNTNWKSSTQELLEDKAINNDLRSRLDTIILNIAEDKNMSNTLKDLRKVLNTLGISLEPAFLEFSFSKTKKADELRDAFDDIPQSSAMTTFDLVELKNILNTKGVISDPFNPGTTTNKNYYDRFKTLADANARFDSSLILKTFQDSEGKTRYSYVYGNHILRRAVEIKNITVRELQELNKANNGYFSLNPLTGDTSKAADGEKSFSFSALHNFEIGLTGNIQTNISSLNREGEESEKIDKGVTAAKLKPDDMLAGMHIMFSDTQMSSKTRNIKTANYWLTQIGDKSTQYQALLPVSNFWADQGFTPLAKEKLFNLVRQEYNRNNGKYQKAIQRKAFLLFPFLDPEINNLSESDFELQKADILAQIETEFKGLIEAHAKDLRNADFVDNNGRIKFLPESIFGKEAYGSLENYLGNFISNHFIYTTGALQLLTGDIAWTKGWTDFVKRMAGGIASGPTLGEKNIIVLHGTEVVEYIDPETLDKGVKGHPEMSIHDGQVFSTAYTKMYMLDALGELTDNARSGLTKLINDVSPKLTGAEQYDVDLISAKLVGYGFDTNGNLQYNKQSAWFLSKGFTTMLNQAGEEVARPGKEFLHNMRVSLEAISKNENPILFSPHSANKIYKAKNPIDTNSFLTGSIDKVTTDAYTEMPGSTFRKQVENDSKDKTQMVFLRQLFDIIGSEIQDKTIRDGALTQFREDYAKIRQNSFNEAKQLVIKEVSGTYERHDLVLWLDGVRRNLEASQAGGQLIEFMDGNYDFNLPHVEPKLKELFLSTFKDAFTKKVSGKKCTLISAGNVKFPVDKESNIVPASVVKKSKNPEKYKETRELKIHKLSENGKEIEEAEIVMTRKAAGLLGVNITDPSKADYLKIVASRIPLQSYHSIVVGKIVDFLPDEYGDTVMAPKQIVYLGGMDYDVDALYIFLPNFFKNDKGEVVKYGQESSIEEKFKGFIDYIFKNNKNVKSELARLLLADSKFQSTKSNRLSDQKDYDEVMTSFADFEALKNQKGDIIEKHQAAALKRFGYPSTLAEFKSAGIESEGITQNRILSNMHKILRSKDLAKAYKTPATHTSIEKSIAYLESDAVGALDKNRKQNIIPNTPLSVLNAFKAGVQGKGNTGNAVNANTSGAALVENKIDLKENFYFTLGGETYTDFHSESPNRATQREKADAGSTRISGAVDNANKPISEDINFDENTIPESNILIQLGVKDLTFIDSFMSQPCIKRVLAKVAAGNRIILSGRKTTAAAAATSEIRGYSSYRKTIAEVMRKRQNQNLDNFLAAELSRKDVTKAQLEVSYRTFKERLSPADLAKLSDDQLKDQLTKTVNQIVVLEKYKQLDHIADYSLKWSSIGSLNRELTSDMNDIARSIHSYMELGEMASPFANIVEAIDNNPVLKGNLKNVQDVIKMSRLFFLSETGLFEDVKSNFLKIIDPSITKSDFLMRDINSDFKKNLLSFISGKLQKTRRKDQDFDKFFHLIMSEYGLTLASQFNKLLKKDNNGNYLKPDFAKNFIVRALKAELADSKNNKRGIDLLTIDSRTKFSPKVNEKFTDALQSLYRSSDTDISDFAGNLFKYCIIKDNLQFANNSILKFVPAPYFKNIAMDLKNFNSEVAYTLRDDKIKALTGQSLESLTKEFIEIYGRHKVTNKNVIHIKKDLYKKDSEGVYESNVYGTKENKEPVVKPFTPAEEHVKEHLFLTQTTRDPEILFGNSSFVFRERLKNNAIAWPYVMKYNNKTYVLVKTYHNKDNDAEYREVYPFGVDGALPYMSSIKATEEATAKQKATKKSKKGVPTPSSQDEYFDNQAGEQDLSSYIDEVNQEEADVKRNEDLAKSSKTIISSTQEAVSAKDLNTIPLTENFSRSSVQNDPNYMYLFTDNAKRTSGKLKIEASSWYRQKYAKSESLNFPSMTQAVIRGLNNAFPITTMVDDNRTQWTDSRFEEYKTIIDDEINQIKEKLSSFKGIKFAAQMPFGQGKISNMKQSAPKIWNYLNTKLAEIGIDNTGSTPKSADIQDNTLNSKSIYNKLGNKTQSKNVVIKSWGELKNATKAITPQGIVSTRIKENDYSHFGNPFTPEASIIAKGAKLIKVDTAKEAVEKYINWILTGETGEFVFDPSMPDPADLDERREWILEELQSGRLKGKPILYYTELGQPSHATALDYLINEYSWNSEENVVSLPESSAENVSSEQLWNQYGEQIRNIYGINFTKDFFLGAEREVQEQLIKCLP